MYLFGKPATEKPQKIDFLLVPGFSLLCFSSALEPMRAANIKAGEKLYEWKIYSISGSSVRASNNMDINVDAELSPGLQIPVLIICASYDVEKSYSETLASNLRKLRSKGTEFGGMDTGSEILAKAGLLNGYKATVHWENFESFTETFPNVQAERDLYVVDRNRFTSGGGTTSLDMMLQLIRVQYGLKLSTEVADQFIYQRFREGNNPQRLASQNPLIMNNPVLSRTIEMMEANIETPYLIPELAQEIETSVRELERLFKKYLKSSPGTYYRNLRLDVAQRLLKQTDLSILDVAIRCGFNSATSFARSYRNRYGQAPRTSRMIIQ
ncbi:GlxA family transcriptional regulator [Kiloniella laminariae]|uniref:GlxA family transcriptional regulator n=1 Tax=Kiloniella laminariae TaxID=454162 RepID=UPI00036DC030|nr:GlxA family transcriptional regulator [Kiloniella laminariae]